MLDVVHSNWKTTLVMVSRYLDSSPPPSWWEFKKVGAALVDKQWPTLKWFMWWLNLDIDIIYDAPSREPCFYFYVIILRVGSVLHSFSLLDCRFISFFPFFSQFNTLCFQNFDFVSNKLNITFSYKILIFIYPFFIYLLKKLHTLMLLITNLINYKLILLYNID